MKIKIAVCAMAAAVLGVGTALADTITVDGRDWEHTPFEARDYPGVLTSIANSGTTGAMLTGQFGVDPIMTTALSVANGDTVSYDLYVSKDGAGPTSNSWIGDIKTVFLNAGGGFVFEATKSYNDNNGTETTFGDGFQLVPTTFADGVHVELTFGADTAVMTLSDVGSDSPFFTSQTGAVTLSDITGFGAKVWDSEEHVIIDNFTVIPEPATFGLVSTFGVGILFARRRLRK